MEDLRFKVVLVGSSSVGKTCLCNMLIDKTYDRNLEATVGANSRTYTIAMENCTVSLDLWDTAGQEKFKSIGPVYYRDSSAAVAVYSQVDRSSFDRLEESIRDFRATAGENALIAIAANKSDLAENAEVRSRDVREWATKNGYLFHETSALTGEGVEELFQVLSAELISNSKPVMQHENQPVLVSKNDGCSC